MACHDHLFLQMQRSGEITAAPGSLSLVDAITASENSQQREALAMERLGFSETIHRILKHTLETTLTTAMEDAVELQAVSAGLEAGTEFEKSELHLRLLELSKEAHLLRIQLDSTLDDLELVHTQRQVLEAQVADQQGMAAEGCAERQLLLQKWQAARVEVQQERCARLKAQSALEGLNKALREEKASRLKAEAEVRLKVSQLQKVEKSHQSAADQVEHLQQQLHDCQVALAEQSGVERERVRELEKQLTAKEGDLQKQHAAGRKECDRLARVVAEQSRELEALESEQATLRAAVQAVEVELGALRASHATLTAENGDLRMLCQEAGAKVPEKRVARKARESPTRNLVGAMEQAAPRQRGPKRGAFKATKVRVELKAGVGDVLEAVPKEGEEGDTAPGQEGGEQMVEGRDAAKGLAGMSKTDSERRFSPRLKRPISAESRQSGRHASQGVSREEQSLERKPKRAKAEPPQGPFTTADQGGDGAPRAPLQAMLSNTAGTPSGSRGDAVKPTKTKRTLAPSASKVLGALPPRPQSKSMFGQAFRNFKVPLLKPTGGTSSDDVDRAILMSP